MKVLNLSATSSEHLLSVAPVARRKAASMPKVPSLLFDCDLEDHPRVQAEPSPAVRSLQSVLDFRSDLERFVLDQWQQLAAEGCQQLAELAQRLKPRCQAGVQSSQGGTSGSGAASLRNLRHTWLSCTGTNGERVLFDPVWREHWEVLNPSPAWAALLASMPPAFCGGEQRLVAAVQLLCRELEAEFAAKGCSLPPWRSLQATLSKWRPAAAAAQQQSRPAQPTSWAAAAPQSFLQMPPRRVSSGFSAAGGCTATIAPLPHGARPGKPEALSEGRSLYSRVGDGFQRANRTCVHMLSNGL